MSSVDSVYDYTQSASRHRSVSGPPAAPPAGRWRKCPPARRRAAVGSRRRSAGGPTADRCRINSYFDNGGMPMGPTGGPLSATERQATGGMPLVYRWWSAVGYGAANHWWHAAVYRWWSIVCFRAVDRRSYATWLPLADLRRFWVGVPMPPSRSSATGGPMVACGLGGAAHRLHNRILHRCEAMC